MAQSTLVFLCIALTASKSQTSQSVYGFGYKDDYYPEGSNLERYDFREDAEERLRSHFALDPVKAVRLALAEQKIFAKLPSLAKSQGEPNLDELDGCPESLQKFLQEFQKDSESIGKGKSAFARATIVSENPLLLYRMIRRVLVILMDGVFQSCGIGPQEPNVDASIELQKILNVANISLPTYDDLEDALMGLIRIHYVYGFDAASEMRLGILKDVQTNVTLNFDDCLELGRRAIQLNAEVIAYQWLTSASLCLDDLPQAEREDASMQLSWAWHGLLKITGLRNIKDLHNVMRQVPRQEQIGQVHFVYDAYATCRGESHLTEQEKSQLNCYNLGRIVNPYWTIRPLKAEQLHKDPPVWQFHDFVGSQAISYIKLHSYDDMARSGVVSESGESTSYSDVRTSLNGWIYDDSEFNPGKELMDLNKRIELCTGFHVIKKGASQALQVVEYSALGGHYDFHDDSLDNEILTKADGDRVATFFMFLSDVPLGGYTAFPKLGVFARPEKGSAILWYSLMRNGKPDYRHLHGGCPVILGSKVAANKWIMQYENMFNYRCLLDPEK